MTRSLDSSTFRRSTHSDGRVASSTGRAVGAALACLLVTSLVVERSIAAIQPGDSNSGGAFSAASLELSDDDGGRSLVNLTNMVPGRLTSSCINISYEGSLYPIELVMRVETVGELAEHVEITVVQGTGGSFEDCDGFVPVETMFSGTLAGLAESERVAGILHSSDEVKSFRFDYELRDNADAIGKTAAADLVWEVRP